MKTQKAINQIDRRLERVEAETLEAWKDMSDEVRKEKRENVGLFKKTAQ